LLVDLGPGRATLMADMLRALRNMPDFLGCLDVVLVEASEKLASVQRQRLADVPVSVRWVTQWSDVPAQRPVFVIANEFFDALPVRQFVMTERGWCERMVVAKADALGFALSPQPVSLLPGAGGGLASTGAVCEICPAATSLAEEIGGAVRTNGGAALIIDYGHEGRAYGDTLQAVRQHTRDDILTAPGEADLSVHVDFSALAEGARSGGAVPLGPAAQANFLRSIGIERRGALLAHSNPDSATEIAAAIERLTGPDAMGTLFKVLAIVPPGAPCPPGFGAC
jgi:NADH dehydrogenase [ubiquinone] 1 alpha subcomplex assembly factor 7